MPRCVVQSECSRVVDRRKRESNDSCAVRRSVSVGVSRGQENLPAGIVAANLIRGPSRCEEAVSPLCHIK